MKSKPAKIDVILSPDLQLAERAEQAYAKRCAAISEFSIGERVRAGDNGKPGKLEAISADGFAAIRWPDGRLLSGIAADELQRATIRVLAIVGINGADIVYRLVVADRAPSELLCIEGRAQSIGSNPYLLFGDTAAKWLGLNSYQDTTIVVATMSSGHLFDFN